MQDARKASHVIRGAKIRFSSNGVVQCNSTFRVEQIGNVFDATHSKRVAQNFRLTKRGLMRLSDCRFSFQDTTSSVTQIYLICG
jgi:hypothetical protein